jgi:hypothetical protein
MLDRFGSMASNILVCKDTRPEFTPNPLYAPYRDRPTSKIVLSRAIHSVAGLFSTNKVHPSTGGCSRITRKSKWVATKRKVTVDGKVRTVYLDAATRTTERIRRAVTSAGDGKRTFKYVAVST